MFSFSENFTYVLNGWLLTAKIMKNDLFSPYRINLTSIGWEILAYVRNNISLPLLQVTFNVRLFKPILSKWTGYFVVLKMLAI